MAIYHLAVKVISRSSGRSATGAAAYRSGEKIKDEKNDLTHDYTKKDGISHTDILHPDDAPDWVNDRSMLWNEVEACEKRHDSQLCREVEVALPEELSLEQNKDLVKSFIMDEFVSKGMVADLAIHNGTSKNPHAHILLTTRSIDKNGFGKKNRDWNKKEMLEGWRKSWEVKVNDRLEMHGHQSKIDHRTLEAQGINRIPQIHLGPHVSEMERRGNRTERGDIAININKSNNKIVQLEEYKEVIENERNREIEKIENYRGTGSRGGAISPSHGDSSELNHRTFEQPTRVEHSSHTAMDRRSDECGEGLGDSDNQHEQSNGSNDTNGQQLANDGDVLDSGQLHFFVSWFSDRYDSALERIKNLASRAQPKDKNENTETQKLLDRTYQAVKRQLDGMNCESYEVGVRNTKGQMLICSWSQDEVLKSVSWLKRENARGADVYIRPGGGKNQGLILVDDLSKGQLDTMKTKGFEPCVVVETSPYNHQAWVRVCKQPLANNVATMSSKIIAKVAGADINSADWRHFGRLSGFTNQKSEHKTSTGRSPWSLCHISNTNHATRGNELVDYSKKCILEIDAQNESQKRLESALSAHERPSRYNSIQTYQSEFKALRGRYGADMDLSRADFMICKSMAKQGFSKNDLLKTLEKVSPELPKRKAGHESDYCKRTVDAVFKQTEIQQIQEKRVSKSHDFGR